MSTLVFDDDAASGIEALYRIEDARRRRRLVREAFDARPGQRVLDVGCGPGFYCLEIGEEVGPAGAIVGVDISPPMLALARRRCAGLGNVDLRESDAISLPVDDGEFDGALSVQVLEYVGDANAALAEMYRSLRPGGRVVVWDVDWATLSIHSEDDELNGRVLDAWDEHVVHPSLPRTLASRLRTVGFGDITASAHPFATVEYDPETYGAAMVPYIAHFAGGRSGLSPGEAQRWLAGQEALGQRQEFSFACLQFCFTARKPS